MKSIIIHTLSEIRASYWYNPLLMAITAILLSIITIRIDYMFDLMLIKEYSWFHADNPQGARAVLSTIATSMITVAGVTFSMTILAVSFAGSQIGPGLTTSFMRDRSNQITLGTFIATFLYCILILRAVLDPIQNNSPAFVPQLSLLVAVLLAISSIIVFIYFIHHIPDSINKSNVIALVGEQLNSNIPNRFPENIGQAYPGIENDIPGHLKENFTTITANNYGYIRILDGQSLMETAKKHDVIIQVETRPGVFITHNKILVSVYSAKKIEDSLIDDCRKAFAYGYVKNTEQDIMFLVEQQEEIIARALSPGINDPFTAITAIDWFQSTLEVASLNETPSAYRYDNEKKLRLIAHPIYFEELCQHFFSAITAYVAHDRNTSIQLLAILVNARNHIENARHKISLVSHAESVKNAALASLPGHEDRQEIQSFYDEHFK